MLGAYSTAVGAGGDKEMEKVRKQVRTFGESVGRNPRILVAKLVGPGRAAPDLVAMLSGLVQLKRQEEMQRDSVAGLMAGLLPCVTALFAFVVYKEYKSSEGREQFALTLKILSCGQTGRVLACWTRRRAICGGGCPRGLTSDEKEKLRRANWRRYDPPYQPKGSAWLRRLGTFHHVSIMAGLSRIARYCKFFNDHFFEVSPSTHKQHLSRL